MNVIEVWKNTKTGKAYQVRQYEEKEVWVNLGCGWFKSDYSLDYIHTNEDFERA